MKYLSVAFKSDDEILRQDKIVKYIHGRLHADTRFFSLFKLDDGSLKGFHSKTKFGLNKAIKLYIPSNRLIKARFEMEKMEQGWAKTNGTNLSLATLPQSLNLGLNSGIYLMFGKAKK